MKKVLSLVLLAVCLPLPIWATRPITPPTEAQMTHAWFGYDNHRNFVRLDLEADGTGTLTWLQLGGESRTVFDIPKWEWNSSNWKLDLPIRARRLAYKDVWLRVDNAGWDQIKISFGDKRQKWDREVTLMNESDVLTKLENSESMGNEREEKSPAVEMLGGDLMMFQNIFRGKTFRTVITESLLNETPTWSEGEENPPLSAKKAIAIARDALNHQDWYTLNLSNLNEDPLIGVDLIKARSKWLYIVHFRDLGSRWGNRFQIPVLMNGIVPKFVEVH
jgi:hypothetical protein